MRKFKDGFAITMAEMHPIQMAWAPNQPDDISPEAWIEAYNGHGRISDALSEAESDAVSRYAAAKAGDMSDEFDSIDDVPRDEVWRARFFENGDLHLFDTAPDHLSRFGEEAAIMAHEVPAFEFTSARICASFGMKPFFGEPDFAAGTHHCDIGISICNEEEFRATFLDPEGGAGSSDLTEADMTGIFGPASDNLPARLTSVTVLDGGETTATGNRLLVIRLSAQIDDPELFVMRAALAGRAAGRDSDYTPDSVEDAIFEAWFGGNDAGSPVDMGFEILTWGPMSDLAGPEDEAPGP